MLDVWIQLFLINPVCLHHQMSCYDFLKTMSEMRSRELSLQFGDFVLLHNSSSSLAYLRVWDQSTRYLAAFNLGSKETTLQLSDEAVPRHASLVLSTTSSFQPGDQNVDLMDLQLGPLQGVLVKFPYNR